MKLLIGLLTLCTTTFSAYAQTAKGGDYLIDRFTCVVTGSGLIFEIRNAGKKLISTELTKVSEKNSSYAFTGKANWIIQAELLDVDGTLQVTGKSSDNVELFTLMYLGPGHASNYFMMKNGKKLGLQFDKYKSVKIRCDKTQATSSFPELIPVSKNKVSIKGWQAQKVLNAMHDYQGLQIPGIEYSSGSPQAERPTIGSYDGNASILCDGGKNDSRPTCDIILKP